MPLRCLMAVRHRRIMTVKVPSSPYCILWLRSLIEDPEFGMTAGVDFSLRKGITYMRIGDAVAITLRGHKVEVRLAESTGKQATLIFDAPREVAITKLSDKGPL